jgi:excisionase family DNA binding protein
MSVFVQRQNMGGKGMQRDETVLAVGVPEAARRLGLSTRTVATLIARRELPSRKVGRRRIIPVAALELFLGRDHLSDGVTRAKCREGSSNSLR